MCRTQQCSGALRRSARRRQGLATPATRVRRAAPLSSWRAGHERQSVSGSGSGSAGPCRTCFVWKPFLLRPSLWQILRINAETQSSMAPAGAVPVGLAAFWAGPPPPLLCYYPLNKAGAGQRDSPTRRGSWRSRNQIFSWCRLAQCAAAYRRHTTATTEDGSWHSAAQRDLRRRRLDVLSVV